MMKIMNGPMIGLLIVFGSMLAQPAFAGVTLLYDDGHTTQWRIDQPNVNQAWTSYPQVQIKSNDFVNVSAGGCVQTGGSGLTWKRYVDPQGANSSRLYHGMIRIPALASAGKRLIDFGINSYHQMPLIAGAPSYPLELGYEDDNYSDNGYWGHDNGTGDQCKNVGAAWLVITLVHQDTYLNVPLGTIQANAPILSFHPNEGGQCCFPSDAEYAYSLIANSSFGENRQPKVLNSSAPAYYQYSISGAVERIKYWFWYNYNDFPNGPDPYGSHEGDWESVEVVLQYGQPVEYIFSNHQGCIKVAASQAITAGGHVKAWVGNGSHANYPYWWSTPYSFSVSVLGIVYSFYDEIADGGAVWNTWANLRAVYQTNFGVANFTGKFGNHIVIAPGYTGDPPVSPVGRQFEYEP